LVFDSRTRIPLFIGWHTSVNEKQPFHDVFVEKISVRGVSETNGKKQPPLHGCRGGSDGGKNTEA
jgi:hypothetical protein